MRIGVINGPNLNLLGKREPAIYGAASLEDLLQGLRAEFMNVDILDFQSNVEGELINQIHAWDKQVDGIILNAGGYTHSSVALRDAIQAIKTPVVEVHISNIYAREEFRHQSVIAGVCIGMISGFGFQSYHMAMYYFLNRR